MTHQPEQDLTRRGFLQAAGAASAALAAASLLPSRAFAAGSDRIRVGLVGCGGRGTGAAHDCAAASPAVQIVALGDVFQDRLEGCRKSLAKLGEQNAVTPEKCFVGFDAFQKVIDSGVDLVILATPPGFRPVHIAAAVAAGKHVFAEKPVAVDAAGVRSVLESAKISVAKKLAFGTGTQRRHEASYVETVRRIHGGDIGQIVAGTCYWTQGGLWMHPRKAGWTDMEWQLRNWLYFTWLSGDHICEQHVHNIDVMNWCIGDHPVSAYAVGGRQVRTDPAYGQIYDHFATELEYASGARVLSMCRQIDNCDNRISEYVIGTQGTARPNGSIQGPRAFRYKRSEGERSPYVQEHVDLIDSIQKGQPINEAQRIAESCLTVIMARMSAYTGKQVSWQQALDSKESLMPAKLEFGDLPVAPVPMPGKTPLV